MRDPWIKGLIFFVGFFVGLIGYHLYSNSLSVPAAPPLETQTTQAASVDTRLPAPQFVKSGTIRSLRSGGVAVQWGQVPGAKEYQVTVFKNDGGMDRQFRLFGNKSLLKNLPINLKQRETFYKVQIEAVDETGNLGRPSELKDIAVIPMRILAPPSIKSITTR